MNDASEAGTAQQDFSDILAERLANNMPGDFALFARKLGTPFYHPVGKANERLKGIYAVMMRTAREYDEVVERVKELGGGRLSPPSAEEVALEASLQEMAKFALYARSRFNSEAQEEFPALRGKDHIDMLDDGSLAWHDCEAATIQEARGIRVFRIPLVGFPDGPEGMKAAVEAFFRGLGSPRRR